MCNLMVVFNNAGDKSVTMCGVAQEDISKEEEEKVDELYNRPWHVGVSVAKVRALHCQLLN